MNTFGNMCIGLAIGTAIINLGALPVVLPAVIVLLLMGIGAKKLDSYLLDLKFEKERKKEQKAIETSGTDHAEDKKEESKQQVEVSNSEKDIKAESNSWKCPKCGEINSKKFCRECGTERPVIPDIKEKVCINCGEKLKDNQKFCGKCGTKVDE